MTDQQEIQQVFKFQRSTIIAVAIGLLAFAGTEVISIYGFRSEVMTTLASLNDEITTVRSSIRRERDVFRTEIRAEESRRREDIYAVQQQLNQLSLLFQARPSHDPGAIALTAQQTRLMHKDCQQR